MSSCVYWIWFQLMFGCGTRRSELFYSFFDSPEDLYGSVESGGKARSMLSPDERTAFEGSLYRAREIELRTRKKGCQIITPEHEHYPPLLREIYAKPAALYVKGDISCIARGLPIAMVGTRDCSSYGAEAAAHVAGGLAREGAVIVSGLARGIDSHCHQAALDVGGETVGVLACGLNIDYPKGGAELKTAMSRSGAVVTEYPLDYKPHLAHFRSRNRIISGMCRGVVIVEAPADSGAMLTANHAADQNRDVFIVPGSIFSPRFEGSYKLVKDGAKLAASARDILEEYGVAVQENAHQELLVRVNVSKLKAAEDAPAADKQRPDTGSTRRDRKAAAETAEHKPPAERTLPEDISSEAGTVYAALGQDALSPDDLKERTEIPISMILSSLTELEIYGLIQGGPGHRFVRI